MTGFTVGSKIKIIQLAWEILHTLNCSVCDHLVLADLCIYHNSALEGQVTYNQCSVTHATGV